MGATLLTPLALLGLLSLLLPLLLHLRRQVRRTPVDFAALRWLQARLRPRARWRIERPWLLLLRLLLASLLVLLLAEPVWRQPRAQGSVLLHPAIDPALLPATLRDSSELRWWAPGFPRLDASRPGADSASLSLLRQYEAELAAAQPLQVWIPDWSEVADGQLATFSRSLDWQLQPAAPPLTSAQAPLRVWRAGPAPAEQAWLDLALQLLAENEAQQAAVVALPELGASGLPAGPLQAGDTLVWWPAEAPHESLLSWVRDGGQLLWAAPCLDCDQQRGWQALWRSTDAERALWTRPLGAGRILRLNVALDPSRFPELLEARFPEWLHGWLLPDFTPQRIDSAVLQSVAGNGRSAPLPVDWPLTPPLALLLALLWLVERIVAGWRPAGRIA